MNYTVIWTSEDGDVRAEVMSENELLKRLNERYWGDVEIRTADSLDDDGDLRQRKGLIILKGEPIVPTTKQVVTEYVLP